MRWNLTDAEYRAIAEEVEASGRLELQYILTNAWLRGKTPLQMFAPARHEDAHGAALYAAAQEWLDDLLMRHVADPARRSPVEDLPTSEAMTRDCLDPWTYLEVETDGALRPCCIHHPIRDEAEAPARSQDMDTARNGAGFRALRASLLEGRLGLHCRNCHIRAPISPEALLARLDARAQAIPDLQAPLPLELLRLDITGRCNLRCDYCYVTAPGYSGRDMDPVVLEAWVTHLETFSKPIDIHINGHGETTYHPGWMEIARRLLDAGHRLHIITNLARRLSDDECATLGRFTNVQISLDSSDAAMMRTIRKAVRPQAVQEQIARIRAAVTGPEPAFTLSCGLYDPSVWTLQEFCDWIIATPFQGVTFWPLVAYSHQKLSRPIAALPADDQARARAIIQSALDALDAAGITAEVAGGMDQLFA